MKEYPILFKNEMVRAILAGRKTQTRRVVKAGFDCHMCNFVKTAYHPQKNVQMQAYFDFSDMYSGTRFPYGKVGALLWVREIFCVVDNSPVYFADIDNEGYDKTGAWRGREKWRPSIHMPRWASRITLEVTDVRVHRLQEISAYDALAEGITNDPLVEFQWLWDAINAKRGHGWNNNPWVWAINFKRVEDVK